MYVCTEKYLTMKIIIIKIRLGKICIKINGECMCNVTIRRRI